MDAIGQKRETQNHWQKLRQMIVAKTNVPAVSWQLRLALLKDTKLDVESG